VLKDSVFSTGAPTLEAKSRANCFRHQLLAHHASFNQVCVSNLVLSADESEGKTTRKEKIVLVASEHCVA
jgi:hypothetical protein